MLFYELVAGELPYHGSLLQVMEAQAHGPPPPPPSHFCQDLDVRADAIIMRAIERNPARRHPSAEALHFDLRTFMNMIGIRVRPLAAVAPSSLPASVQQSPIPIAMFEPSGTLRFANLAFLALADGVGEPHAKSYDELQICRGDRTIARALERCVKKGGPVYRKLPQADGAGDGAILMLAPELRAGSLVCVHATLMQFPSKS
jgi:hypothetical protein